jgi:hypothetical protein
MSYPSRYNRYYDSMRSLPSGNARLQSNMGDDNLQDMSEDLQKIFDDDSKCARLLKKVLREDRSVETRLQRVKEFQIYLDKFDSKKVRHNEHVP